ncbi:MAG TPA: NAD-dependent epimerase/dehydratase family protein [Ilumatobacteraceae bacterium]|nr:NAD-dependent epimerase/dehydratase family protein [Ilumatobacteraceae bacterium]
MSRVVVTGGAGFLGSHLCRALLDRGDEVVAIDNLVTGSVANIEALFGRRGFAFVEHDVSTYVWVPGDVDAVMHLASPASPADFERIPIQILKVGGLGTHNGLGLAKAKGARFFLASTSEVYGDPLVHPQPETYWGNVNPIGTRGVYDEAKRYAEAMTMAYHRHHGLDTRIVRIFNSVLADEQVLYDDGTELRRETIGELARRVGDNVALEGYCVPAFDATGRVDAAEAIALVGHPPTGPCFEVRTRYGRSIRVTGDHSLFVEDQHGRPSPLPVSSLKVGDRVAIAAQIDVPTRDRTNVSMLDVWSSAGGDPWRLSLTWPGLGGQVWDHRQELLGYLESAFPGQDRRSRLWPRVISSRDRDMLTLAEVRRMGFAVPAKVAQVRLRSGGPSARMPLHIDVSDEFLWTLGLWVAEGSWQVSDHNSFITISGEIGLLERAAKVFERDLGLHTVWAPASVQRAASIFVHGQLLIRLMEHLGFGGNRKRIPGWILGLPLARLKWFIEGYRCGDGVHSGKKFEEGIRHEFSTTSTELKDDLVVALARFGICPSVGRYETTVKQRTGERRYPFWRLTLCNVDPWSPLEWDDGVDQGLNARRTGDLVWAAVTEISEIEPDGLVYDFSVPGRENFWAGTGVMAHNTFGPSMRPDDGRAVSNFLVQALRGEAITIYGDGSQTRSFTYVDDEIRGFLALLDSDITTPVNIGNPTEYTISQLAEMAIEVTGSSSELTFEPLPVDDPTRRQPDITLARKHLGWEPTVELREGLERTAEYFRGVLD